MSLRDGSVLEAETDNPKGDPENPASDRELQDKFLYLTGLCWPEASARKVLEKILNLETLEQVEELFNLNV